MENSPQTSPHDSSEVGETLPPTSSSALPTSCSHCGETLSIDTGYCPNCGAPVAPGKATLRSTLAKVAVIALCAILTLVGLCIGLMGACFVAVGSAGVFGRSDALTYNLALLAVGLAAFAIVFGIQKAVSKIVGRRSASNLKR